MGIGKNKHIVKGKEMTADQSSMHWPQVMFQLFIQELTPDQSLNDDVATNALLFVKPYELWPKL